MPDDELQQLADEVSERLGVYVKPVDAPTVKDANGQEVEIRPPKLVAPLYVGCFVDRAIIGDDSYMEIIVDEIIASAQNIVYRLDDTESYEEQLVICECEQSGWRVGGPSEEYSVDGCPECSGALTIEPSDYELVKRVRSAS